MRRKTNLFYTSGEDSNFITFSNYTEALTGNFLATDWKMFPSKFMCLKMDLLAGEAASANKENFIHMLASKYENKLAFVRDWCMANDKSIEDTCLPLEWLIECLYEFDPSTTITFIGEVTEQDYNGLYADTICIVDGTEVNRTYKPKAPDTMDDMAEAKVYCLNESTQYLHGWYNELTDASGNVVGEQYTGPRQYERVSPVFDGEDSTGRYYNTGYKYSTLSKADSSVHSISFDILIPLFDMTNVNYRTNMNVINEAIDLTTQLSSDAECVLNVPMGIWFANETITLQRDSATGYAPSWSLLLSSQFKPFPYSEKMPSEVSSSARLDAYQTYAQVLVKQNEMIDTFTKLTVQLADLSTRIESIETKISSLGTTANIDGLHVEMLEFKKYIESLLDANGINDKPGDLEWQAIYSN